MKIHLIDTDIKLQKGSVVETNCGEKLVFEKSIGVMFDDGRVCEHCLFIHRTPKIRKFTLAVITED